jgi:hypothetical protein
LANANPHVPALDLPLFLYELREYPRMARSFGDILAKRRSPEGVAGGYLAYQFGWAPLLSDLRNLLEFADLFERQMSYINSINNTRRTDRTIHTSVQIVPGSLHNEEGVQYRLFTKHEHRVWYSVRWKLPDPLTWESEMSKLTSVRNLLGLRGVSAATIWNAIPFSWLIDYFINIGNFLDSVRGSYGLKAASMCLMQMKYAKDYPVVESSLAPFTPFERRTTLKTREVTVNPLPTIWRRPIITERMSLNMLALLVAGPARAFHVT